MDGLQEDGHPTIEEFFQWRTETRQRGIGHSGLQTNQAFLPYTEIDEYFREPDRIGALLRALFPRRDSTQLPDAGAIRQTRARVFCILLCTGRGDLIEHFTRYAGLGDQHLPFQELPANFPTTPTEPDYFETFKESQWEFCAPELRYGEDIRFGPRDILPIIDIRRIGGGGTAFTYKIILHRAYDKLVDDVGNFSQSQDDKEHAYVLKTYHTDDARDYYYNEWSSFKRLRDCPSMIGFFGSFRHNGTYNILLEYADQGTLEDYFKRTSPPRKGEDICNFWACFLHMVNALMTIHNEGEEGLEGPQILQGWHQDVKPTNILVKSGESGARYDLQIKLADLGISHFHKKVTSATKISGSDAHGTRTYGAPETYRGRINETSRLQVKQSVDIWSLGCVISETAVWLANDYEALGEYRQQRKLTTDRIPGFQDGDCFHDGLKILPTVAVAHSDCVSNKRDRDFVTVPLLNMVDRDMLIPAAGRLTAQQICIRAELIVENARSHLLKSSTGNTFVRDRKDISTLGQAHQDRPQTPPEIPPEEIISHPSSRERKGKAPAMFGTPRYDSDPPRRSFSDESPYPTNQSLPQNHRLLRRPNQNQVGYSDQSQNKPFEEYHQHGTPLHGRFDHETSTDQRPQLMNSVPPKPKRGSAPAPYRESYGNMGFSTGSSHHVFANSVDNAHVLLNITPDPETQFQDPPPAGFRDTISRHTETLNRHMSTLRVQPDTLPSHPEGSAFQEDLNDRNPPQDNRPSPPQWPVTTAMNWKMQAKKNRNVSLPEPGLFEALNGRDCIFLIDDASSMGKYWENVKRILELLGYIFKRFDDDGLEIYFTMSQHTGKPRRYKNATELVKALADRQVHGQSNMKDRLGGLLQTYRQKLEQPTTSKSFWRLEATQQPRRLIIYVFTDGVWQPDCEVEPHIRSMVNCLEAHQLLNSQVGVQFIQFGNDKLGSERLAYLDSGLDNPKTQQDIVDVESSDGNVFKMLFGSINEWFDGDGEKSRLPATSSRATAKTAHHRD